MLSIGTAPSSIIVLVLTMYALYRYRTLFDEYMLTCYCMIGFNALAVVGIGYGHMMDVKHR
jgi:hypothetical protein